MLRGLFFRGRMRNLRTACRSLDGKCQRVLCAADQERGSLSDASQPRRTATPLQLVFACVTFAGGNGQIDGSVSPRGRQMKGEWG